MFFRKIINAGEDFPTGYGKSYYDFMRGTTICHLWPLNIFIGFIRKWWLMIRYYYVYNNYDLRLEKLLKKRRSRKWL